MSNGVTDEPYVYLDVGSPYDTPFNPSFTDFFQPTDLPPSGFPQGASGFDTSPVDMGLPPLVVDVYGGTPEPQPVEAPGLDSYNPPGSILPPQAGGAGAAPEGGQMSDGFMPGTSGVYFPSLGDIFNAVQSFLPTAYTATAAPITAVPRTGVSRSCYRRGRAPLASLFGGACPPGTVLHRKPLARDICARKRHMNVLNPCALSKASRRVTGFLNKVKNTQKHLVKALSHAGVHGGHPRSTGKRGGCVTCGARTRSTCIC
jgi:hypothetical protein